MKEYDVFISYSSEDELTPFEICYVLEQHDLKCWIAPRDVAFGEPYAKEIMKGIKASKVVVFVMSDNSLNSVHVLTEMEHATTYERDILPFRIDETLPGDEIGHYIKDRQWLNAFPHPHEEYDVLIKKTLASCGKGNDKPISWTLEGFNPKDIIKLKKDYPSLILLFTPIYWASFIYMGIVGNENLWKITGFLYLIPSVICLIFYFQFWGFLFLFYPIFIIFLGLFITFWILAIIHGMLIRNEFLTKKSILRLLTSNRELYEGLLRQYSKY